MEEKKRFYVYMRVSSIKQKDLGTIKTQEYAINNYLNYKTNIEVVERFIDDGISSFTERPAFSQMMEKIISNEENIDGVLIYDLSRIGRSTKQLLQIEEIFKDNDILFVSIKENIDTSTPMGKLVYTIHSALLQYEAENLKERTAMGRRRARAEGVKMGRPKIIFNKSQLNLMKKMYFRGMGTVVIGKYFDVSYNKIRDTLIEEGVTLRAFNQSIKPKQKYKDKERDLENITK